MASRLDRLAPPARLVDWSILTLVGFELLSGVVSLTAGTPDWGWLFALHGVAGLTLVALLFWKLRRVRPRVTDRSLWDRGTPVSIALATLALGALATGAAWSLTGVVWIGPWTLLTGHMLLGLLVIPVLAWHLRHRFRLPSRREVEGRRTALQFAATVGFGALIWRSQRAVAGLLELAGADRRFTGSGAAAGEGNDFPVTSWVADDPDPVDTASWELTVRGAVEQPFAAGYGALDPESSGPVPTDQARRAVLDCTSGWYADREWEGVPVGALLDAAGPTDEARWVRFRSVTGYRWSLPLEEARSALLATRVDGEALSHGHGAPLRLVAPGRRGFQWVKWVTAVEVTRSRDLGQWIAIFVSGL